MSTVAWWNDDGTSIVLDLDLETASALGALPEITGGGSAALLPVAGLDVRDDEVVCMRLTDEGHLAYLAVGPPSDDLLELFKRVPGENMGPRKSRAWRRALQKDARVFLSVVGDLSAVEFLQSVRFPLELVNAE